MFCKKTKIFNNKFAKITPPYCHEKTAREKVARCSPLDNVFDVDPTIGANSFRPVTKALDRNVDGSVECPKFPRISDKWSGSERGPKKHEKP